jgi:hypothetical protein
MLLRVLEQVLTGLGCLTAVFAGAVWSSRLNRRRATHRIVKRWGTVLCAVLVAIGVVSMWVEAGWLMPSGRSVWLWHGNLSTEMAPPGMVVGSFRWTTEFSWSFLTIPGLQVFPGSWTARMPIWSCIAIVAAPTICAWWKPRRRAGLCGRCRYDLSGNTTGVCPECGTKLEQA